MRIASFDHSDGFASVAFGLCVFLLHAPGLICTFSELAASVTTFAGLGHSIFWVANKQPQHVECMLQLPAIATSSGSRARLFLSCTAHERGSATVAGRLVPREAELCSFEFMFVESALNPSVGIDAVTRLAIIGPIMLGLVLALSPLLCPSIFAFRHGPPSAALCVKAALVSVSSDMSCQSFLRGIVCEC